MYVYRIYTRPADGRRRTNATEIPRTTLVIVITTVIYLKTDRGPPATASVRPPTRPFRPPPPPSVYLPARAARHRRRQSAYPPVPPATASVRPPTHPFRPPPPPAVCLPARPAAQSVKPISRKPSISPVAPGNRTARRLKYSLPPPPPLRSRNLLQRFNNTDPYRPGP